MDIKNYMEPQQAQSPQPTMRKESMFGQVVGQYNEYGNTLRQSFSMRELAEKLMEIADYAESTLTTETAPSQDDWYDKHTISRNVKEMKSYVKEFGKLAEEYDTIRGRATALYDDMGRVLERYFEVTGQDDEDVLDDDPGYDTDDDQVSDLVPGNISKSPQSPSRDRQSMGTRRENVVPETKPEQPVVDEKNQRHERNKNIRERMLRLARHKLTGEQLVTFDTLPEDIQLRAAWRVIR
jgi:hypothetical protein